MPQFASRLWSSVPMKLRFTVCTSSWSRGSSPTLMRLRPFCTRFDLDRKSTRLNSSHSQISYAVFCLKKKKKRAITDVHTDDYRTPGRRSRCHVRVSLKVWPGE